MGRRIDYLVTKSQTCHAWIRCDQPHPIGRGTSFISTQWETQYIPSLGEIAWPVRVALSRHSMLVAPPPRRERTAKEDNCGTRIVRQSVLLPLKDQRVVPSDMYFADATTARTARKVILRWSDDSYTSIDCAHCTADRQMDPNLRLATTELCDTQETACCAKLCGKPLNCAVVDRSPNGTLFVLAMGANSVKLCRLQQDACELHHDFNIGPLGCSIAAYDSDNGRFATTSLHKISGSASASSSSRGRFALTLWRIEQNRNPLSMQAMLR